MSNRSRIRYRGNGAPPKKAQFGPWERDEVTGFPTRRDRRVQDDYGYWVDPRWGGGADIDEARGGVAGSSVSSTGSSAAAATATIEAPTPAPEPAPEAGAITYYVSPAGAGNGSGSSEANAMSLLTFEQDYLGELAPDDVVGFCDGDYSKPTSGITISRSGTGTESTYTSTAPITFRAVNSRQARFVGPDYSGGPATIDSFSMFTVDGTDIVLSGLHILQGPLNGIDINGKRCTVDDCYIQRCGKKRSGSQDGGEGIMVSGSAYFSTIKNSLFSENREHAIYYAGEVDDAICGGSIEDGNIFRYNGYDWDNTPAKTTGTSAIQANGAGPGTGCRRITIQGNRIYYSSDNAILFLETHDSTITENYCYGNDGEQIQVSVTSTNNTVSNNEVASDTRACIADAGGSSGHIITGNRCWTEALTNTANVAIEYKQASNIATSANNIFHHQGPSVARNDDVSPVDYFTLAEYQTEVSDATSTEITDGTITQFDTDIQAWINAGGGVALPPDPNG